MSNIGTPRINIPEGVNVNIDTKLGSINVKGKNGELFLEYNTIIEISEKDNIINVVRKSDDRSNRELHGLYRALINNMILGVSEGFSKELNFVGVGYSVEKKGDFLLVNAGFSHPIYFTIPKGINIATPKPTRITVQGINKQQVGEVSAKIRSFRKPEPYKGKGIKYVEEIIRRKAGKTVGAVC